MRFLLRFLLLLIFLLIGLAAAAWWWANAPLEMRQAPTDFRVLPGSSLRTAALQIEAAGIQLRPDLLVLLARSQGVASQIKAGSYAVDQGITPRQLLAKLTRGELTQGEIRLPEGGSFAQWRRQIDQHPDLRHVTTSLTESQLLARLGLSAPRMEGLLFPDTYLFDKQSSDLELYARAQRAMQARLDAAWAQRATDLPYKTPYEALIMASIIEKETGRDADRAMIASVFVNRLRRGMLLQTDPTVIYGLGTAFDGNLRKHHLRTDTPYNTYTRAGLPPAPISMPGNPALLAAVNPASSEALYFVARGDGSSQFSRTLAEHNQAVNLYQKGAK